MTNKNWATMKITRVHTFLLGLFFTTTTWADLSFTVQPNILVKDPALYSQVAKQLTQIVGEPVIYTPAKNLNTFSRGLWRNKYDIVLMEPHIAAWFLRDGDNGGTEHDLLLASNATERYQVLTPEDKPYLSIHDLNGKYVCSPISPSLGAAAFLNKVNNPVNPPSVFNIKNNAHAFKSLQKKRCEAVVVESRDEEFWKQQPIERFKSIFTSTSFPGWVMTIYSIHPPQIKSALSNTFSNEDMTTTAIGDVFKAIEKSEHIKFIKNPKESDYHQYNILPGVVWGW